MDYIALTGVNCFLKREKSIKRLLFAAAVSSACSLGLVLLVRNPDLRLLILHFPVNVAMVVLAFGKCKKKTFFESWAVTYFFVILLGGIVELETEWMGTARIFWIQAGLAAVLLSVITRYLGRRKQFGNQIFPVEINNRDKKIEVCAYWDSGNQLKDPYSGKPVSILGKKEAEKIYASKEDGIRYVPYCSLGKTGGLLPVFTADRLTISTPDKQVTVKSAVIGVAEDALFEKREYTLILHASFLEN